MAEEIEEPIEDSYDENGLIDDDWQDEPTDDETPAPSGEAEQQGAGVSTDSDYSETSPANSVREAVLFTSQPTPPYDYGDFWQNGSSLYACINPKAVGGSYSADDWSLVETIEVVTGGDYTTETIEVREYILDYSAEHLNELDERGATFYAIWSDGSETEVTKAQVTQPVLPSVTDTITLEGDAVALANNQHFWQRSTDPDSDGAGTGAFITDEEQDDFLEASAGGFTDLGDGTNNTRPWHNLLMNSLGILLRTGLNNLVSITRSAIAFFDGEGNQAGNVVASFGSNGAQIGKSGAPHININDARIAGYTSSGAPFLDIDYNGSETTADVVRSKWNWMDSLSGDSLVEGSEVTLLSIDVSDIPANATKVPMDNARFEITIPSASISVQGITASGLLWSYQPNTVPAYGTGYKITAYLNNAGTAFTLGTSATKYATFPLDTYSVTLKVKYDASAKTVSLSYEISGEWDEENPFEIAYWLEASWSIATSSPSFTMGTRFGPSGAYSLAMGEGLYAEGANQTVIGRWNVEDANNEYALIIGNGTDDTHRSNALTVKWDGSVSCGAVNGMGTQVTDSQSSVSVASSTNTDVASVSLTAGIWMVCAKCQFPANSTGKRAVKLSTVSGESGNVLSTNVQNAAGSGTTQMSTSRLFKLPSACTVYLVCSQTSGGSLSCAGDIEATRLG